MKNLTIFPTASIKDAFKTLTDTGEKCLIVVDEKRKLIGTVSDGDLRNAILKGMDVNHCIEEVFNNVPTCLFHDSYTDAEAKSLFLRFKFDIIPLIDNEGVLVDFVSWEKVFGDEEVRQKESLDVPVVIMAGGKGTRLEPFTTVLPKPLIPIHDKPIIEHIIDRFQEHNIKDFWLTVSHKSRILKAYFEEVEANYTVRFVTEQEPLGTASSLKLLQDKLDQPFFVTNCDTIINSDYADLYDFHLSHNYDITLVASMKQYVVPFGTCHLNGSGHLDHIEEKPDFHFLVNTGLYILNPQILELIPVNRLYHITDLIDDLKSKGKKVGVYPISEDAWIDVGQWGEYHKALSRLGI